MSADPNLFTAFPRQIKSSSNMSLSQGKGDGYRGAPAVRVSHLCHKSICPSMLGKAVQKHKAIPAFHCALRD